MKLNQDLTYVDMCRLRLSLIETAKKDHFEAYATIAKQLGRIAEVPAHPTTTVYHFTAYYPTNMRLPDDEPGAVLPFPLFVTLEYFETGGAYLPTAGEYETKRTVVIGVKKGDQTHLVARLYQHVEWHPELAEEEIYVPGMWEKLLLYEYEAARALELDRQMRNELELRQKLATRLLSDIDL